eukprot:3746254-Amphidinium_carterae.1
MLSCTAPQAQRRSAVCKARFDQTWCASGANSLERCLSHLLLVISGDHVSFTKVSQKVTFGNPSVALHAFPFGTSSSLSALRSCRLIQVVLCSPGPP